MPPRTTVRQAFSVSTTGEKTVKDYIDKFKKAAIRAAARAVNAEHEITMTEAKKRTPVDKGILRASGHVDPVKMVGDQIVSTGSFGGPTAPYADFVHENLAAHHPVGRAKFYESAVLDAAHGISNRIAARMKSELG